MKDIWLPPQNKTGQAIGKGIKAFANGVDAVDNMILNGANAAGRGAGKLLVNGANQLMDNAAFVGRASADLGQYIGQGVINGANAFGRGLANNANSLQNGANYIANATINGAIKGGNGIIRIGNTLYQNTANGLVALKNSPYGPAIAGGTVGGLVGGGLVHYLSKDDEEENTEE